MGVWFRSRDTARYLYLLRNDAKHPGCWALPGGKVESGETELGEFPSYEKILPLERFNSADGRFEYNTWICVVATEFQPVLNHEHLGYAWISAGEWPRPMHPGLWNTLNIDAVREKMAQVEGHLERD